MDEKLRVMVLMGLVALIVLAGHVLVRTTGARTLTVQGGVVPPSQAGASPQTASTAFTTTITYQGQLQSAGVPVTGNCDFQFGLWDGASGGTQIGITQTVASVGVTNGLFTTQLNSGGEFGSTAFDGNPRWLALGVSCPADGDFTPLSPRQPLTPAPFAFFAADVEPYANVVVVAKSGGDYVSIQAALDSITDASAGNRYLVWIAPGTYGERVTMKPYVDLEGAGELVTKITYTGSSSAVTGTVVGADDAELRFVSVENTGGDTSAFAIFNNNASPRLTHVTASAAGGTFNIGVYNYASAPVLSDVTARATGSATNYGVSNNNSAPSMTDVTVSASGGTTNYGVFNASSASPTMRNATIRASGGSNDIGVYNTGASASIHNSDIAGDMQGVYNTASGGSYTVAVHNSRIAGSANTIRNDAEYTTRLGSSLLDGGPVVANGGAVICADSHDGSAQELGPHCKPGKYDNTRIVAKAGGDYTSIQAALESITDASSANPYLVWVAPGVYAETVTMKPHVDLEGAGRLVTTITSPGFATLGGTVAGANNTEIRSLRIENTGGDNYAVALFNSGASPHVTDVSAVAADGSIFSYGVYNTASSPEMTEVTAHASGSSIGYAISNNNGSSPVMNNVVAIAPGPGTAYGMANNSSSALIRNSQIQGDTVGISNSASGGTYTVELDNSQISGGATALVSDAEFTTRIGATRVEGGPVNANGGTVHCTNSHNGSGQNLGRDCQPGNTVYVARTGGDFASVQAALDAITDASPTNRYLIRIGPGLYNEQVTMKPYVDIEGAGELATKISFSGSPASGTGTVLGASEAELRSLTIVNTGGAEFSVAIYNNGDSPRLSQVTASAAGGNDNRGIFNDNGSSPTLADVTVGASGGITSTGIYNSASAPAMTHVTASAAGASDFTYGLYIDSAPTPIELNEVSVSATGAGIVDEAVTIIDSDVTIQNSRINTDGYGVMTIAVGGGSYTVEVNHSEIRSGSWTLRRDAPEFTLSVGASLLHGGSTVGFPTCAGVYDENYDFYSNSCP